MLHVCAWEGLLQRSNLPKNLSQKHTSAEIASYVFVMKNKFGEDRPEHFKVLCKMYSLYFKYATVC